VSKEMLDLLLFSKESFARAGAFLRPKLLSTGLRVQTTWYKQYLE
jgi:hypothetical protein